MADEAAKALLELSQIPAITSDDVEAAQTLVNMKMLDSAYALFSMGKEPPTLKSHLASLDPSVIEENIEFLVAEGILPPTDEVVYIGDTTYHEGGEKRKADLITPDTPTPAQPPTPASAKRPRTPSAKVREQLKELADKEKERELDEIRRLQAQLDEQKRQEFLEAEQTKRLESLTTYEETPAILKSVDVCAPRSAGLIMKTIFPPKVIDVWKTVRGKKCRDIYEFGDIPGQCKNVIPDKPKVCYLCGFPCDETIEGLQATCEHILPIIQAVFFLELYKPGQTPPFSEAQLLEYAWAHRCCNYVKNDFSFIKTKLKNNYPSYEFNGTQVSVTLSTIVNTKGGKFQGVETVQTMIKDKNAWKKTRIASIRDNQITPILNYIAKKGDNGMAFLIGYRNCLTNENIHADFVKLLSEVKAGGRKTFRRKRNGKSVRRTTAKGHVATSRTH